MAIAPGIKHRIPDVPETCELCTENQIQWKCFTCTKYQFMCKNYAKGHMRSELTQNHHVTSINDIACQLHLGEVIQFYCNPCDMPICRDCMVSGSHQSHSLVKIEDAVDMKHKELSNIIAENGKQLNLYENNINIIRKIRNDYNLDIQKCIEEIKSRHIQLKVKLDQITTNAIAELQQTEKQNQDLLERQEIELEIGKVELKKVADECVEKLSQRNIEMVQFVAEVTHRLDTFSVCETPRPIKAPNLEYKDEGVQELSDIFGNLKHTTQNVPKMLPNPNRAGPAPTTDVKVIKNFDEKDKNIIASFSDDKVWMGEYGLNGISLVKMNGKVKQNVKLDWTVSDLAAKKSGKLLATTHESDKVKKLKSNNTFRDLYTAPANYCTLGLTVADNDNVIVCLYDYDKKEGKLVELSSSGNLIRTIQYQRDGQTPLFENPLSVCSNRNGDLIVRQLNESVLVVDKDNNKRFIYTGQEERLNVPFDPRYTVTDRYGHILISDRNNHAIHLLNKDGKFVKYIRTDEHGVEYPKGMCIDRLGRLWVCSYTSDKVIVLKYLE